MTDVRAEPDSPDKSARPAGSIEPMSATWATSPVAAWLVASSQNQVSAGDLTGELCRRLAADGIPLFRVSFSLLASHPQVFARNLRWSREGGVEQIDRPHAVVRSSTYRDSPVALVLRGAPLVRRRLHGPDASLDFPIVRELRDAGATDYVGMPLRFSNNRMNFVSWATDREDGFTAAHLARLQELLPLIAMRFELESTYYTMQTLLEVYLGKGAGQKVLSGTVRRAEGDVIRAAIWYSDLRGFTAMTDRLASNEIIATLDDYFDCMVGGVHEHGGDVLKFIGDGLLAIFPVAGELETPAASNACGHAIGAARSALERLADLNRRRAAEGEDALRCGIALHVGQVTYGNIGAEDRLDFTAIGPAVNLVSRVEPLCRTLGQPVLVSEDFAHCSGMAGFVALGAHDLHGFAKPQNIYALPPHCLSETAKPA